MTPQFRLSATKLKRYLQCPRAYFLRYVQRVPEEVGGKFLEVGNAFDQAVQAYCSGGARGVRSIDPKIVGMLDVARRHLPAPNTVEVQHQYQILHPDGFIVEGKPDLRRPLEVGDTKTTADRGEGMGRDRDATPIALNAATLARNEQGLLYAWCEFQLDPAATECVLRWVYVTKETKPKAWAVRAVVTRTEVEVWFDSVARPAAKAMAELHAEVDADRVRAELDACDSPKCWVRAHCDPFTGPNSYDGVDVLIPSASLNRSLRPVLPAGVEGVQNGDVCLDLPVDCRDSISNGIPSGKGVVSMAFDLKRLAEENVDLETPLRASLDEATGGLTLAPVVAVYKSDGEATPQYVGDIPINPPLRRAPSELELDVMSGCPDNIPINPPGPSAHAADLEAAIAQCRAATERAERLLATLRGAL